MANTQQISRLTVGSAVVLSSDVGQQVSRLTLGTAVATSEGKMDVSRLTLGVLVDIGRDPSQAMMGTF